MIIPCIRCGKKIDTPDETNADYVIAADLVATETREVMVAFRHNQATLDKKAEGLEIDDSEYDQAEIDLPNIQEAHADSLVEKLSPVLRPVSVQKTGIICPGCYEPDDTVIWGVHKKDAAAIGGEA